MNRSIRRWITLAAVMPFLSAAAVAGGTATRTLNEAFELPEAGIIRVENLIGSLQVIGGGSPGVIEVEARVVAEADEEPAARRLVESIAITGERTESGAQVRITYPVESHTAFRLPKSEVDGLMSKWITPLLRKRSVAAEYGGHGVEVGQVKGAAAMAVHVRVTLPRDVNAAFKQYVGSLEVARLRGSNSIEVVEGHAEASQLYGALKVRSSGGNVTVRTFKGDGLEVHTGSGEVEVLDVSAERIALRSASGWIGGQKVTATELRIRSESGNIELRDVEPSSFEIASGSGAVDLATRLRSTRKASIRSDSGDITLRVGEVTPFELTAETGSGKVKTKGVSVKVVDEGESLARLQRGTGGVDVRITTETGEVFLRAM